MEAGVEVEDLFGEDGLPNGMKKRMPKRILEAKSSDHLDYGKHGRRQEQGQLKNVARPPRRSRTRRLTCW